MDNHVMYHAAYACGDDALTQQSAMLRHVTCAITSRKRRTHAQSAAITLRRRIRVAPLFLFRAKYLPTSTAATPSSNYIFQNYIFQI